MIKFIKFFVMLLFSVWLVFIVFNQKNLSTIGSRQRVPKLKYDLARDIDVKLRHDNHFHKHSTNHFSSDTSIDINGSQHGNSKQPDKNDTSARLHVSDTVEEINTVGANPVGANPVGANPVGANPVEANPVGANPVGANPVGANVVVVDPCVTKKDNLTGSEPQQIQPAEQSISHFDLYRMKWEQRRNERQKLASANPRAAPSTNQKLVIMTYMRSGSSFTGDLFQQSPEVFYVYEPLSFTDVIRKFQAMDKRIYFINNTSERVEDTDDFYSRRRVKVMQDVLSCRFDNLDIGTIKQYHMHSSVSTYGFGLCSIDATATENTTLMSNWVFNVTEESLNNLRRCTEDINPECHQTNYLVVKVIRLTMQELGQLMDLDPDFKVLYLVRDPRGTVRSQNQLGEFDWTILNNYTKSFCERVRSDIQVSKTVFDKFPHRVMQVRYEDIIENPIARTQQLYRFINLEFTPPVKEYIWNITFAGNQDDCNICTTRKNATETAYAWRKVLSFDEVNLIQSHCSDVMKHFGYRPFDQKELSDFNISSYYQVKR